VQKGDYNAAIQAFDQQLKIAQQLGDPAQVLLAHGDIGLAQVTLGRYPEALAHFEESCAIARSLHNDKDTALGLTNRANTLWQLGRYDEARALFAEAAPFAEPPNAAKNMVAWFYLAGARMALSENHWSEAINKSWRALELAGSQAKGIATESTFTLGLAEVFSGATREGRVNCDKAVAIARETGNPSLEADSLLALAQALIQSGDKTGALKASTEAQEILSRLGKHHYEWLAWLIMARANRSIGDSSKTPDCASRAENLLAGLQQQLGGENYNAYLNRPDIQFYRKQLNQLLAQKL
jgi:tetratricopeptide (TPR) repeat protein